MAAVDPEALEQQVRLYRSAAQIGLTTTAARSNPVLRTHHAFARRLLDRQDDYLHFTTNWRIPPDNNGFRTRHSHDQTPTEDLRLSAHPHRSHTLLRDPQLPVAAKHGRRFFEVLVMLAEGHPWLPANS